MRRVWTHLRVFGAIDSQAGSRPSISSGCLASSPVITNSKLSYHPLLTFVVLQTRPHARDLGALSRIEGARAGSGAYAVQVDLIVRWHASHARPLSVVRDRG